MAIFNYKGGWKHRLAVDPGREEMGLVNPQCGFRVRHLGSNSSSAENSHRVSMPQFPYLLRDNKTTVSAVVKLK